MPATESEQNKNDFFEGHQPFPKIIFGTSSLGNLYQELTYEQKLDILSECLKSSKPVVLDSAGKYGAGLSLEVIGKALKELDVPIEDVIISNKLGWMRTALSTAEPTFESRVWKNLDYDAYQNISYKGILECFEQGNELLQGYTPQLVSVHDPDEYLMASVDQKDYDRRFDDILEAYNALLELKQQGKVKEIGVGAKDWKTIKKITDVVSLDWVMIANSMTIYHHPPELMDFVRDLNSKKIRIINSAVFHGGFLIGSDYFNYKLVSLDNEKEAELFKWREKFHSLCKQFHITPAEACVYFALSVPGVESVALNSSSANRIRQNMTLGETQITPVFWEAMKSEGLIRDDYPYL